MTTGESLITWLYGFDGIESDDLLAAQAVAVAAEGHEALIVSSDKDFAQIVNERIKILNPPPPGNPKANYVENPKLSSDPRAWYYDAQHVEGSWWPQWLEWVQKRSGVQRETLTALGNQNYPPMEAAPGTYVRVR